MWNNVINNEDIKRLLFVSQGLHDGCIKEIHYISGAYVDDELCLYPINDRRMLSVIIQQSGELCAYELVFSDLVYIKMSPIGPGFTCEIMESALWIDDDCIYWADSRDVYLEGIDHYEGTIICAKALRWRNITHKGDEAFWKMETILDET